MAKAYEFKVSYLFSYEAPNFRSSLYIPFSRETHFNKTFTVPKSELAAAMAAASDEAYAFLAPYAAAGVLGNVDEDATYYGVAANVRVEGRKPAGFDREFGSPTYFPKSEALVTA